MKAFKELYDSYVSTRYVYAELLRKYKQNPILYEKELIECSQKVSDLRELCAKKYCEEIEEGLDAQLLYLQDLLDSVLGYDLLRVRVLIMVPLYCRVVKKHDQMVLIIKKMIEPFYTQQQVSFDFFDSAVIFEQVMDVIEGDDHRFIPIMDMFLSIEQTEEWYEAFFRGFEKFLSKLPHVRETFEVVKKGICHPYSLIQENIESYLVYYYLDKGLADEEFNWIE